MRNNRPTLVTFLVAIALSGCASTGQSEVNLATQDCQSQAGKSGLRCMKNHPNFRKFPQAQQDFIIYAAMLEEQRNAGKITQAEADYAVSQYNQRQEQLRTAQSQAQSQALMSAGTTLLAVDAINRRNAPISAPAPTMRTTNCNAVGNMLNCNSF